VRIAGIGCNETRHLDKAREQVMDAANEFKAMPIDVTDPNTRITLAEAAKEQQVDESTVWRWASPSDYLGRPKPYLETARFGGRRYTTREAIKAYQRNEPPKKRQVAQVDSVTEAYWRRRLNKEHGVKV
jgi:hypothetical protein